MLYNDAVVVTAERTEMLLQLGNDNLDLDIPKTLDARTGDAGSVVVGLLCKVAATRSAAFSLTPPQTAAADPLMALWVWSLPMPNDL